MITFWIILVIIAVYFFLVFVVLRLVAPFMGFRQYLPPTNLPPEIVQAIAELEKNFFDQYTYLQAVYDFVMQKNSKQWGHTRGKAVIMLPKLFIKDLSEIWHRQGFVYCTAVNFIVYTLLANSKFFKAQDVRIKHVFVNFVLHQYLQVKVEENWIDVDPAGTGIRGKPLGTHLAGFG
jgi:hypothetical protein